MVMRVLFEADTADRTSSVSATANEIMQKKTCQYLEKEIECVSDEPKERNITTYPQGLGPGLSYFNMTFGISSSATAVKKGLLG